METVSRYEQRGVSSSKEEVHAAVAALDKGLYPGAFCKILPDILGGDPAFCNIQHADGAGTKAGLAYLYWKLTGDLSVWKGIICDSLFMNLDDAACVGALGPFLVSLSIDRNKFLIPGEVISALIQGCQEVCDEMTALGIPCYFGGGETADVPDLTRTLTVNNTVTVRFPRSNVIDASRVTKNAFIVAFSSTGQAFWEKEPNSGIGSNGLTNARHDVFAPEYREHTETFAPEMKPDLVYCGDYRLNDPLPGDPRFTVASALLSPTRTYLPLVARIIGLIGREEILAFIHCSGGGQTKTVKFGPKGTAYVKNRPFPLPPLFRFLKEARNLPVREMLSSYNCGSRFEAIFPRLEIAEEAVKISQSVGIEAQIAGTTEENENSEKRSVVIKNRGGNRIFRQSLIT